MPCTIINNAIICTQPQYKLGDQAPEGYIAWHEWASVQHEAGLRQKVCGRCGTWKFPQELSGHIDRRKAKNMDGVVTLESAVCLSCIAKLEALSK